MSHFPRPALLAVLLAGLIAGLSACTDDAIDRLVAPEPAAKVMGGPAITVMSQNLYLGADLDALLNATTPADLAVPFQQLMITSAGNMGRMQQIAMQIAQRAPHLVGLQEVTRYIFDYGPVADTLDYIAVLQAYLNYFHSLNPNSPTYQAVRQNLAQPPVQVIPLPTGGTINVTYQDGDAVLIRDDVPFSDPTLVKYDSVQTLVVGGTAFTNDHGYIAVTAQVGDMRVRFVNTHLEVQLFGGVQTEQTEQLINDFADETLPVIMVGDFNSAANHDAPEDQMSPSYHMFRNAGYADMWLREAHSVGGVTCCQAPDLLNVTSQLTQRLDLVLVRWNAAGFGGRSTMEVVGEEPGDRITVSDATVGDVTLWPSDHAAVAATLWPAPGLIR
ncbi:MAG: endonuclease/exonuclease/phosphatase family protein [Gemmatimonadota bacterium]